MTTKKNLVKLALMSTLTAGIFSFSFALTSCSDDDIQNEVSNNDESAVVVGNENELAQPLGLVYKDFINPNDVQILNADTTEISVSKAYADKMGIDNFVNHPMGIWQSQNERAYLRRPIAQRLEGDRYILSVIRSGLGEVLIGQDVEFNTAIFVNPNAEANTRGSEGMAERYTDANNVIHPVAVTRNGIVSADGSVTRSADGLGFATLTAEEIMNGASFDDAQTRNIFDDIENALKTAATFINNVRKNGLTINGEDHGKILNLSGEITPPEIKINLSKEEGDTMVINSNLPYDLSLDYTLKLNSKVGIRSVGDMWDDKTINPIKFQCNYFEGRLDGELAMAPEVTIGVGAKAELPKNKQDIKLCDLDEFYFTFMAGYIPVAIIVQPHLVLHIEAGVEGKLYTGIKYEYASEFSAGVKYDKKNGGWGGIAKYKTTKSDFSFITPRGTFTAKASAGVQLACDILLDGVVGPKVSIGPEVRANLEATLSPFDENPFTFEAGIKAGLYGSAGATLKLWKIELMSWKTGLSFGPEWDIWSYKYDGKKESNNGGSDKLKQQVEKMKEDADKEISAQLQKQKEANDYKELNNKLNNDPEIRKCAYDYLPIIYFEEGARKYQFKEEAQKVMIIDEQMDKFMKKYGRAPIDNNADYQTLKSMITERIKTIENQELTNLMKKSPFCK
jgi:hypothetical protein